MIMVYFFRKSKDKSFIVLALILSIAPVLLAMSFFTRGSEIFENLPSGVGSIFPIMLFIAVNFFTILIYLIHKKIFTNKILLKYILLPIFYIVSGAFFTVVLGELGSVFFLKDCDEIGCVLGVIGLMIFSAQISV